jgi:hypothetical protein
MAVKPTGAQKGVPPADRRAPLARRTRPALDDPFARLIGISVRT